MVAEFSRWDKQLKLHPLDVAQNGTRVKKYGEKDVETIMACVKASIPRRRKRRAEKASEVKISYDNNNVYGYIQNKVTELKNKIQELEQLCEEKDRRIAELEKKDVALDRIKNIFGE